MPVDERCKVHADSTTESTIARDRLALGRVGGRIRMVRRSGWKWTLLAVALSACTAATQQAAAPPTTDPSARIVRLIDAVPLDQLPIGDRQVNLTDKLVAPQVQKTTYFGEIDEYADDSDDNTPISSVPIIAVRGEKGWMALPLVGTGFTDAGWSYVAAGPSPQEIWAALDTVAGDSRPNFVLAHSSDGGATFELTVFHKPCKLAAFFDFAMSRDGHGRATVSLDSDCGRNKAGLYHYQTNDDGKTWSSPPHFEPDVMIRSDPVPDEEQPDETDQPGKTSSFPSHNGPAYVRR